MCPGHHVAIRQRYDGFYICETGGGYREFGPYRWRWLAGAVAPFVTL